MKVTNLDNFDEKNTKYNILLNEFEKYGYSENNLLSLSELSLFLDRKSPKNKFDSTLLQKFYKFLNLNEYSIITVSKFISGFFSFNEKLKTIKEELYKEYIKKKEIIENIKNKLNKYKKEKLNEEGFSANAKLIGEILLTNFSFDLQGIKEIIIKIQYGKQEKEIIQKLNQFELDPNKNFEFKASSIKDNLKFILFTKNDSDNITQIGSQIYSSEDIIENASTLIQIDIPSNENNENYIAEIKARIYLVKSDYDYYNVLKEKEEQKLNKIKLDFEETDKNIKKFGYIYSDKKKIKVNEDKDQEVKDNIKKFSKETFEFPKNKFIIEFNNERIDSYEEKDYKVNFNNEKKIIKKYYQEIKVNNNQDNFQNNNLNNKNLKIDSNNNVSKSMNSMQQNDNKIKSGNVINKSNELNFITNKNQILLENNNKEGIKKIVLSVKRKPPIINNNKSNVETLP